MLTVTFQGQDMGDVVSAIGHFLARVGQTAPPPGDAVEEIPTGKERKPRAKKPVDIVIDAKPLSAAEAEGVLTKVGEAVAAAAETPAVEAVQDAMRKVMAAKGPEALLALLNKHGGKSTKTLPEANRAAFIAEANADVQ
jgi:hypothetical protein